MTRAVLFFLKLAAVIGAAAWLADRPGRVAIEWQGYLLETSVGVLAAGVLVTGTVAALLVWGWRSMRRAPRGLVLRRRSRRREQGYRALTLGMVAVAAGDADEARRLTKRANALLDEPPLTLLLAAQSAQLDGDEAAAERYFKAMLERPETAFLGLRGLLMQARRRGDAQAALGFAERAQQLRPGTPWVLQELFELQTRDGRWAEAERSLDGMTDRRLLAADSARRARAILRLERSREAEARGEGERAIELARDGLRMAPDLAAASTQLARLHAAAGRSNTAQKTLETAWNLKPHPDVARAWSDLFEILPPLERFRRFERLTRSTRDHPESHLALAEAAIAAQLWGEAHFHLDAVTGEAASVRACRLAATLAANERGDMQASRNWLERAASAPLDNGWVCTACGAMADRWTATCRSCGSFDSLAWQAPGERPRPPLRALAGDRFVSPAPVPATVSGPPAAPSPAAAPASAVPAP